MGTAWATTATSATNNCQQTKLPGHQTKVCPQNIMAEQQKYCCIRCRWLYILQLTSRRVHFNWQLELTRAASMIRFIFRRLINLLSFLRLNYSISLTLLYTRCGEWSFIKHAEMFLPLCTIVSIEYDRSESRRVDRWSDAHLRDTCCSPLQPAAFHIVKLLKHANQKINNTH